MVKKSKITVSPAPASHQFNWEVFIYVGVILTGIIICAVIFMYPYWYHGRVFPGVVVGGAHVGNYTQYELRAALQNKVDEYSRAGIAVSGLGSSVAVYPTISALRDLDLTYDLFTFDIEKTAQEVMSAGRGVHRHILARSLSALGFRIVPHVVPLSYNINNEAVALFIRQEFGIYEQPAQDAALIMAPQGDLAIQPEQGGQEIDMENILNTISREVAKGAHGPVYVKLIATSPRIVRKDIEMFYERARALVAQAPYEVFIDAGTLPDAYINRRSQEDVKVKRDFTMRQAIDSATLSSWLTVYKSGEAPSLGISTFALVAFLAPFHEFIDVPAHDAKFLVQDGKVTEFQSSVDGYRVDDEATRQNIENYFLVHREKFAPIAVGIERAKIHTAEVNSLGIRELIGTGTSDYSRSPKNRRHNIATGIGAVNGTLISPGEEFSLLKTLGDIDSAHGYLPELVIKGNRTIPEYGGGLCQIGTTAFRAALASGMPITERRNHSYRVRYYEPAGTDATIYSPSPDFRFLNDTNSYLLFQARSEGDTVVFELWGNQDGRIATSTKPSVYNIVVPPPTKYVKTKELPVGEKRCTESPHNGADASFTYTVTYPSGEVKEQEFKSHYRPWQEVCLIGAEEEDIVPTPSAVPVQENSIPEG